MAEQSKPSTNSDPNALHARIRELERELTALRERDHLVTKLPNRAWFRRELKKRIESASGRKEALTLAFLFLDLDDFNGVNQRLGYRAGDFVLRNVAERWLEITEGRQGDCVLGRLGGDEFGVLVSAQSEKQIMELAEELRVSITSPRELIEAYRLTVTVGISIYPADVRASADLDLALERQAELAMFAGKKEGGNRCCRFVPLSATDSESAAFVKGETRK